MIAQSYEVTVVQERLPSGKISNTFSVRINGVHIYRFVDRSEAEAVASNIRGAIDGTGEKEDAE